MQNVKVLAGVTPEASVEMAQNVSAPIQDVEVRATVDHKNNPGNDKTWQGYMVYFANCSDDRPHVIPISASRLLAIQEESDVAIFTETEDGLELSNFRFGIENGSPVFEG